VFASQLFLRSYEGEARRAPAVCGYVYVHANPVTRFFLGMCTFASRSAVPTQGLYRYGRRCGRHRPLGKG
jgi:hypothetical protein